jgi:lipocalin
MGLLSSRTDTVTAVSEVNLARFAGQWYEIATLNDADLIAGRSAALDSSTPKRYERNVVHTYTAKQYGSFVYLEAIRRANVEHAESAYRAEILPNREYTPVLSASPAVVSGYFSVRYDTERLWDSANDYVVALLGRDYSYALVFGAGRAQATVLARGKTLKASEWRAIRDAITQQLNVTAVERRIRWTRHDGVERPVVQDEQEFCTMYM